MGAVPGGFTGWLARPGRPFRQPVFIPYNQRSLVLVGANGYGKTRLLSALLDPRTPRVFARLPPRLAPYLAVARGQIWAGARAAEVADTEALFVAAESARATGDEHEWWAGHLGLPDMRWLVSWAGDDAPGTLAAVPADDLHAVPAVVISAAPRHVAGVIERWTVPDALSPASLAEATEDAFRAWAADLLTASGERYRVSANPLIAVDAAQESVSLLSLGLRFAQVLAARAAARLELLTGLHAGLRCLPAERFAWQVQAEDGWIPLEWASRAVSRWAALTVRESLKELAQYAAEAAAGDSPADLAMVLRGDLDGDLIPPGEPRPFASQSSWVALDEPEVHLFASEARRLGEVLAGHGRAGRTVIVTHALDLAARFVGNADFVMFDGPGRFTIDRPADGLPRLLERLARSGPGILAVTRMLYVEGDFDVEVIEALHGELLARHNILLSPMNGVRGANLAASSVWQRMMTTPFGMMFDALAASDVSSTWSMITERVAAGQRDKVLSDLRRQLRELKDKGAAYEVTALLYLFEAVLKGGLEGRLRLVMHGLSDIFQVMRPTVFGIEAPTWRDAGYDGTGSFKDFVRARTRVDLKNGTQCRVKLDAFTAAGLPVDAEANARLGGALLDFASD